MPIFLALPLLHDGQPLERAVLSTISTSDRYKLQADRGWLIKFPGTTVELSNLLKITGHPSGQHSAVGSSLVTPVTSYYGVGPTEMWEWLKTRMEQ